MSGFSAKLVKMCASFYFSVSVDTLILPLLFYFIIFLSGLVSRSFFALCILLLCRYFSGIQCIVHPLSTISYFFLLFIVGDRTKLKLMFS